MTDLSPALLLLPNLISDHPHHALFLPVSVDKAVSTIDGLIAESETAGRRYLGRFQTKKPARDLPIATFNVHSKEEDCDFLLEPIRKGERWGFVSDSGLPCIADPGAPLVFRARQLGLTVQGFVGPSSLMLALMLSGLPGQQFSFHGYLKRENDLLKKQLMLLEKRSSEEKATQIFIETPYRHAVLLETLLQTLSEDTFLCIASELLLPTQRVLTQSIKVWKKSPLPNLAKRQATFLIHKK